ncbi:MAG: TonB-dependent receptor [Bacteroidota bacterium]
MFKSILAVALLVLAYNANAQFSITGSVHDSKDNRKLAGATLQVDGNNVSTVTDEFGWFRIDKLSPGDHTVRVRFLGYDEKSETINLQADLALDFSMNEASTLTDEVVVVATRANDKTPTTFSNVSTQAIQKQNFGQDLPYILNWTPSVVTTSDAGAGVGYTGLRVRGSDASRVNVTINGIPYNDSESQGTYWVDIPDIASSTQSIQIQRGVGTSSNGAGAFGASLNVQTNSLRADPYTEIMTAAGSFNTQRYTLRAGTGLINNRWAFDGKVSKITSDGYVERAASDLNSYYLSGGYYGKNTMIKAIVFGGSEKTYQSWYGVDSATLATNRRMNYAGAIYGPDGSVIRYYDNQVDDYKQDHYQLHISQQLGKYWNANAALHYTYGRGYYEEYHQGESFANLGLPDVTLKDTTLSSSDVIVRQWLDNKFYGITYSLNYTKNKTNLVWGGAYNEYAQARHFGEVIWAQYADQVPIRYQYYQGTAQKNDFNTYAKWNYNLTEKLNTFVDLQYRHIDYKTSGIRDDQSSYDVNEKFDFFNPKFGLSYTLSEKNVLYGSYAVANREPNRSDFVDGDVKPRPEHLENLEMGWRRNTQRYVLELNYYLMNYTDQLVLTGALNNVGSPIRANVGKSYRTGLEASAVIRISSRWSWNVNATWSVNKNKDFVVDENNLQVKKNTSIILSPGLIAGSQVTYSLLKNFQITWLAKHVGKQYLDNTETERLTLPSYVTNDLRFNYQILPKGMKEIGLSFLANNIFDAKYSSNGAVYGSTAYYYPQAGRNYMVMMTLKF